MIENKKQGFVFGLLMSYVMAIGMEVYNMAIKYGVNLKPGGFTNLTYNVIGQALIEALYMGLFVEIISSLYGNKCGERFMLKHTREIDSPYFKQLMRQAGTVAVMCPSMSLVASILFNIIFAHMPLSSLPVIWLGTLMTNLPMAFFWNMFYAAPFVHFLFNHIKRFLV